MTTDLSSVKALVFDVFGTVVDWRSSIIADLTAFGARKGIAADWTGLTDDWRGAYRPTLNRVIKGELPFARLDDLHRGTLDGLLEKYGVKGLSEAEKDYVNKVWHRLNPWPDSVAGLTQLKRKYLISTLSNGNVALLTNMARNAGLPWDCIISSELARAFKPDPKTYQTAAALLDLPLDQVMLVAAHVNDLRAAKRTGLRAAYVPRPFEFDPNGRPTDPPDEHFDYVAKDFVNLAEQLGA